jgi:hypothetical protein
VATVVTNTSDEIIFRNTALTADIQSAPTLQILAGDWDNKGSLEAGIVFETQGNEFPMLTATDARKLAKWLNRAADLLEDVKTKKKKPAQRNYDYSADDDDDDLGVYRGR